MRKKGIALIVVLVLVVLFSALILVVVLSATMAIRKAHYYTDKTIALEIAESGMQQILYNLNYYGYQEDNNGTEWTRASWIGSKFQSSSYSIPQWYSNLITNNGLTTSDLTEYETELNLPEYAGKGKYKLYFIDANSTTNPETDLDLVIVKGTYKGKTATISCLLRGAGEIKNYGDDYWYGDFKIKNTNRTQGSCGISEAFNKHTIYATNVSGASSSIEGNITTISSKPPSFPWSEATWVETPNTAIPVLGDDWKPEDPEKPEPEGLKPLPSSPWKKFKDNDGAAPYESSDSTQYETTLSDDVTYSVDGTNETYTIDGASIGDEKWVFEKAASGTLTVKITGNTTMGKSSKWNFNCKNHR